ncbi:MAG: LPD28 domain-containing protein [Rikenellaceae bacterium]
MKQSFEKIEINNREALFTNDRIDRSQVPQGYYAYDIRHDDDDDREPATIEPTVDVNHFGTILTEEYIGMTEQGFTPVYDINFLGEEVELEVD